MHQSYKRPKEPDPIIWKGSATSSTGLSVASTTVTLYSPFQASYGDLSGLVATEPLLLPPGSLDHHSDDFEDSQTSDHGSRHGKYISRKVSRELSFDGESSDVEVETAELFMRLLVEADRQTSRTGCHVKVTKLTTSKANPQKTILRHTSG